MSRTLDLLAALDPFAPDGGTQQTAAGTRAAQRERGVLSYLLLDVFTRKPLAGNPVAVVSGGEQLAGETMQRIAREFNLSETVFALAPQAQGDMRARIFTPAEELPFAGHPVLGSAVALGAALGAPSVVVETAAAPVRVALEPLQGRVGGGRMTQPLPSWQPFEREAELLAALGVERSLLPVELYDNGPRHVYVALADEREVAALRPDGGALAALGELCVSAFAGSGSRWRTRMFAPALGVSEDPATGSAAGPLALHLARHGRCAFGEEIEVRQGEEMGRPSLLRACAHGARTHAERVEVGGDAVFVARGALAP